MTANGQRMAMEKNHVETMSARNADLPTDIADDRTKIGKSHHHAVPRNQVVSDHVHPTQRSTRRHAADEIVASDTDLVNEVRSASEAAAVALNEVFDNHSRLPHVRRDEARHEIAQWPVPSKRDVGLYRQTDITGKHRHRGIVTSDDLRPSAIARLIDAFAWIEMAFLGIW